MREESAGADRMRIPGTEKPPTGSTVRGLLWWFRLCGLKLLCLKETLDGRFRNANLLGDRRVLQGLLLQLPDKVGLLGIGEGRPVDFLTLDRLALGRLPWGRYKGCQRGYSRCYRWAGRSGMVPTVAMGGEAIGPTEGVTVVTGAADFRSTLAMTGMS